MEKLRLRNHVKYLSQYNIMAILCAFVLGIVEKLGYVDSSYIISIFILLIISVIMSNSYMMMQVHKMEHQSEDSEVLKENEREYLVDAVHKNIKTIVEVPVHDDTCVVLEFENGKITSTYSMNYDEYIRKYAELIDNEHRDEFVELYLKDVLLTHLVEHKEEAVTQTYGRIVHNVHMYIRRTSTLIKDEHGRDVIYTYTEQVDDISLIEAGYKDALLYMFDCIYSIDLDTLTYQVIYQKENRTMRLPSHMNLEELIEFGKNYVHPDDIRLCFEFYNGQYLRKIREFEDTITIDYRLRLENSEAYVWIRATIIFSKVNPNLANLYIANVEREHAEKTKTKELIGRNEMMEHHMRMLSEKAMGKYYSWNLDSNKAAYVFDSDGHMEEYEIDQMIDRTLDLMEDEEEKKQLCELLSQEHAREKQGSGSTDIFNFHEIKKGKKEVHRVELIYSDDPASPYVDLLNRDVTEELENEELKETNRELRSRERLGERFRIIAEHTKTYTCEYKAGEGITYMDSHIPMIYEGAYDLKEDLVSIWARDGVIHEGDQHMVAVFFKQAQESGYAEMIARLKVKGGDFRYAKIAASYVCGDDQKMDRILFTVQDVDEKIKAQNAATYRADYDILTGLYNMDSFIRHTTTLLSVFDDYKFAVVQLDIAHFKLINEVYGRAHGDALLCHIGNCLRDLCESIDCFARMNSDVFLICLHYDAECELRRRLDKLINNIESFPSQYKIMVSAGVYCIHDINMPITTMVDYANLALKEIKGSNSYLIKYYFYDDKIRQKMLLEKHMESEMQDALLNREFIVYLQPKVSLETGEIVGAEALVRWLRNGELVAPTQFIPLFEKNGFIVELDAYIWEEVCKIIKDFESLGLPRIPISTNVSRMNIYSPDFAKYILQLTEKYQISQNLLELELTESVFLENPEELYNTMIGLQEKGFKIAMDDFGSGYSSLNMLRNVPIDILKIDKDFFDDKYDTTSGFTIIESTIALAHKLHLSVVAEGIETEEQRCFLLDCGCDMAQGYLFSKPVTKEQFVELLKQKCIEVE